MAKYTMVFHAYLGDEGPNEGPLGQEKEYDQYPVVPRVGEEIITGFGSLDTNSRWLFALCGIRYEGQPGEIVDLIPAHD
jgi:hypothetical protein